MGNEMNSMNDTILGILICMIGLWVPFIIWDHAGRDKEDKWYAIPLVLMMYLTGVGTFALGVYTIIHRFL